MSKSKKSNSEKSLQSKCCSLVEFGGIIRSHCKVANTKLLKNISKGNSLISFLSSLNWTKENTENLLSPSYKCTLCLLPYNNLSSEPICLPCGHSFCRPCVFSLCNSLISGKCPIDSKEFFYIEDLLPINYALLNSKEDPFSRICLEHKMPIIGFCIEHSCLLCGKCIFQHKSHKFFEINSNEAEDIIEKKMQDLKNIENQLNKQLTAWEVYENYLNATDEKIKNSIDFHVEKIRKIESEIIVEIHSRTELLIDHLLQYQKTISEESTSSAKEVIECLKFHIESAKSLRAMLAIMNICDKLTVNIMNHVEVWEPDKFKFSDYLKNFEDGTKYRMLIKDEIT